MGLSGRIGDVEDAGTDVVDVLGWTFTEVCSTSRRATSDSATFKRTFAGTRSASGEVRVLFDQTVGAQPFVSGQSVTFKLQVDAADFISVPAIIASRSIEVDIDEGEVVSEVYSYESNGAWTETRA